MLGEGNCPRRQSFIDRGCCKKMGYYLAMAESMFQPCICGLQPLFLRPACYTGLTIHSKSYRSFDFADTLSMDAGEPFRPFLYNLKEYKPRISKRCSFFPDSLGTSALRTCLMPLSAAQTGNSKCIKLSYVVNQNFLQTHSKEAGRYFLKYCVQKHFLTSD
jgi:hypothetical protein